MVAGVAGGDHKTAAETVVFGGDDQWNGCKTKSNDSGVLCEAQSHQEAVGGVGSSREGRESSE